MSDLFGNISIQPPSSPPEKSQSKKQTLDDTLPADRHTRTNSPAKPKSLPIQKEQPHVGSRKKTSKPRGAKRSAHSARANGSSPKYGWILAASTFVALFFLYNIAGFWGIPYYFSNILPNQIQEEREVRLSLDNISFNPYTFELIAGQLHVQQATGETLLDVEQLSTRVAPLSLLRNEFVCNDLQIDGSKLNVVRNNDGLYNFASLFSTSLPDSPAGMLDFSELPFRFSISNIKIRESAIRFEDRPAGKEHKLENVSLDLPSLGNIDYKTKSYLHPRFSALINGSPIELSGESSNGSGKFGKQFNKLSCELKKIDLTSYAAYLPVALPFNIQGGVADGTLDVAFESQASSGNQLSFDFALDIQQLQLATGTTLKLESPSARIKGMFAPVSKKVELNEISLHEAILTSYGPSFNRNIAFLISDKKTSLDPPASGGAFEQMSLSVDAFTIDSGSILSFNRPDDTKALMELHNVQCSLKNFVSTPSAHPEVEKNGSFTISGEKDEDSYFSYQARVSEKGRLSGPVKFVRFPVQDMPGVQNFSSSVSLHGTGDLQAILTVSANAANTANNKKGKNPGQLNFELEQGKLVLPQFELKNGTESFLKGSVELGPLQTNKSTTTLGNVWLKGCSLNYPADGKISKLLSLFASAEKSPKKNNQILLSGLSYDGDVAIQMKGKQERVLIKPFDIKANKLDDTNAKNNISLNGKIGTGGEFTGQGNVSLHPFSLSLRTDFKDFAAGQSIGWFSENSVLKSLSGALSGQGSMTLPELSFVGDMQVSKGTLQLRKDLKPAFAKLQLEAINYRAEPFHLGISNTRISGLSFPWNIDRKQQSPDKCVSEIFISLFPENKKIESKVAISAVDLQKITIENGNIHLRDERLEPVWEEEITQLQGTIEELHSATSAGPARFYLKAMADQAQIQLSGNYNFFKPGSGGENKLSFTDISPAMFEKQLAGKLNIDRQVGNCSLEMTNNWTTPETGTGDSGSGQQSKLKSSGTLNCKDIRPDKNATETALALALLSGSDENLELTFDYSRPEPVADQVLFDDIVNQLQMNVLKAGVSPLLIATGDFSDLIGNEFTEFQPGEFMISDQGRDVLARYTALLLSHPRIGLELYGGVDPKTDAPAIKAQLEKTEQERIDRENQRLRAEWQEKKKRLEAQREETRKRNAALGIITETDLGIEELEDFVPVKPVAIKVDDRMLRELAERRLSLLQQYFAKQLALQDDRVIVREPSWADEFDNPTHGVKIRLIVYNQ